MIASILVLCNIVSFACGALSCTPERPGLGQAPNYASLRPVVVTPKNHTYLMKYLTMCNVERALVGGYYNHIGDYVLYAFSGAVVPAEKINWPDCTLCTETCYGGCERIVLVCKCDDQNKLKCMIPVCRPQPVCPPACPPQPICPPQPVCPPQSAICKPCPVYVSRKQLNTNTCHGTKLENIKCSRTYIFECITVDGKKKPILKVYSTEHKDKEEIVELWKGNTRLNPDILNCPSKILNVKRDIEKLYKTKVCIYIDTCGTLYVRFNGCLYQVQMDCSPVKLKPIHGDMLERVLKRGLFGVEFK